MSWVTVSERPFAAAFCARRVHVARVEHVLGRWGRAASRRCPSLRGDDQRRVGDRGVERLRVVRPREDELLAVESVPRRSLQRERERELLARVRDRLHVDDRHRRVAARSPSITRSCAVVLPALELREGAHADEVDVARRARARPRATCSSASPSITVPSSNSIGHAPLPGSSTTAWPPSWNAPISKRCACAATG